MFLGFCSLVEASTDSNLPDNVKIITSEGGKGTTIIINSEPGITTNVETYCVDGKCTSNATSKEINSKDLKKIKEQIKEQQEAIQKFWDRQEELFKQQREMLKNFWDINWF